MIRRDELEEEIRRCQLDPVTYASIAKLANLITVHDYFFGNEQQPAKKSSPEQECIVPTRISTDGESEFLKLIDGMQMDYFLPIIDELMTTIHVVNPKLYDGVMRNLSQ